LLLEVINDTGRALTELVGDLHRFPQKTINVRVARNARQLLHHAAIEQARAEVSAALASDGRLILRASGTEPLIRVTVEARDAAVVERHAQQLADVVRKTADATSTP